MKRYSTVIILFFTITPIYSLDLRVEVSRLKNSNGQILIGLYNSPESFLNNKEAFDGVFLDIKNERIVYVFNDIPIGEYAIAIVHDENSNGELDQGLFGIPKEGYAFSNNVSGLFSAPKFKDVSFKIYLDSTEYIKLKY